MGIVQDPDSELLIEVVAKGSFLECGWLPSSSASCLFSANRKERPPFPLGLFSEQSRRGTVNSGPSPEISRSKWFAWAVEPRKSAAVGPSPLRLGCVPQSVES